ncbi:hypothetical protein GCM10010168_76070 [Actinoplanes ianthinogenes]|uniref:HTH araC/xylS-type domain-containing protein n=1 Tax=Actinoplanes ianthinogenes TaxID=122358 RepID=A0ABM7M9X0_9ACTN|nr:AraC family transcriptional regulator [Actinoplanes ianthinogenes]BCJ48467.1 hypothetical protein Aiant_91240 [Actinoplanes ianthinogenes]GGR46148.1 hypothetical protein GCM10010168_76070 [Actinoplanes ianthinogenes]
MPGRVAVERAEMRSHDLGEVHELLCRRYVDHRPRILGRPDEFLFSSASAWAGGLTVDHLFYGATMAITADPFDTVVVVSMLDGRLDVTAGDAHHRIGRGGTLMYLPGVPLDVRMDRMRYQVLQFPLTAAVQAASRSGIHPSDVRFDGMAPISPAANRHWLATMAYVSRLFAGPEPAAEHPLVLAAALEAASAATVATFPNTTMTMDYAGGPGRIGPASLRRAVAYIDAHAGQPITLEQIAAAAGVSVRGLQAVFRRHRDTTPMAYLRRVRMEGAHRDLVAGDPARGDTVAGIARRWGFAAPGRFAVEYRALFGRAPRRTLSD